MKKSERKLTTGYKHRNDNKHRARAKAQMRKIK